MLEKSLTKGEIVDLFEDYKTVKGITVVTTLLVKAGYITVINSAVCPDCGKELPFVVPPKDHRIVLTEVGAVRAKVLWDAMMTVGALDLLEGPPTQEEVNKELDKVAKELDKPIEPDLKSIKKVGETVNPVEVENKRVPPGTCPMCRKGKLMKGACDACGWNEADGVECHRGLVKPLENTETCAGCGLYEHTKSQPCTWTKWVDD